MQKPTDIKKGQGKPYHLAQPKRSGVFILFVKMYPIKKVHVDNWSTLMANATLLVRKTSVNNKANNHSQQLC